MLRDDQSAEFQPGRMQRQQDTVAAHVLSQNQSAELIADIRTALARSRMIVIGFVLTAIVLALFAGLLRSPTYEATGRISISDLTDSTDLQRRAANPLGDSMIIDSEVESLTSGDLLERVAERLHDEAIDAPFSIAPNADHAARQESLNQIKNALSVERVNATFVIDVRFEAGSPDLAARFVNVLIEEFRLQRQSIRVEYMSEVAFQLQQQIAETDAEVARAEREVEEFMAEFSLESSTDQDILEENIGEALEDLIRMEAIVQEFTEEISAIQRAIDAGEMLKLPDLNELSATTGLEVGPLLAGVQELELLVETEGDKARRDALVDSIAQELKRYIGNLEARRAATAPTLDALNRRRASLGAELTEYRNNLVSLRSLERNAHALEARHIGLLDQLQDTRESSRLSSTTVQVLQTAVAPIAPSGMGTKTLLVIAGFSGLTAGVGFALLREQMDGSFRKSRQLEVVTGLPYFGSIPFVSSPALYDARKIFIGGEEEFPPDVQDRLVKSSFAARMPDSRSAKAMERTIFEVERRFKKPATISILSTIGEEGKSFFSANLGFFMAKRGHRVLIVDVDRKNHGLSTELGDIGQLVETGLDKELKVVGAEMRSIARNLFVVSFVDAGESDVALMIPIVEKIKKEFAGQMDAIILDTPPIAYLPESRELAKLSDASILVVKWGATKRNLVSRILAQNAILTDSLIGAVFSQTDPALFDRYEQLPNSDAYYVEG